LTSCRLAFIVGFMTDEFRRALSLRQGRKAGPRRVFYERNCSVGRTIAILSDSWAFLILRESYFGATRFETFQSALGLPRATLTQRLRTLTAQGLLRRVHPADGLLRFEYRLTAMGIDLYPVMLALLSFGDKWLTGSGKPPIKLVHNLCGCTCRAAVACSHCKVEVTVKTVTYRDGPGAGSTPIVDVKRSRRASDPAVLDRGRPSSVARALKVIGDRWSFMIIREGFFGACRFDELQSKLGIAPNILADRLNRLVAEGVFHRCKYQSLPQRFEYRFTEKGKDLYGPMLAMLRWGDRWLSGGKPPLILTHLACGTDFEPTVICDHCKEALRASDMSYKLNYSFPSDGRRAKASRPLDPGGS
jgi:DNA-binding HxlR family transcriptional regulator